MRGSLGACFMMRASVCSVQLVIIGPPAVAPISICTPPEHCAVPDPAVRHRRGDMEPPGQDLPNRIRHGGGEAGQCSGGAQGAAYGRVDGGRWWLDLTSPRSLAAGPVALGDLTPTDPRSSRSASLLSSYVNTRSHIPAPGCLGCRVTPTSSWPHSSGRSRSCRPTSARCSRLTTTWASPSRGSLPTAAFCADTCATSASTTGACAAAVGGAQWAMGHLLAACKPRASASQCPRRQQRTACSYQHSHTPSRACTVHHKPALGLTEPTNPQLKARWSLSPSGLDANPAAYLCLAPSSSKGLPATSAMLACRFVYDSPMPLGRLVRQLADKAQIGTQRSWKRPYGVGLMVAGVDESGRVGLSSGSHCRSSLLS